MSRHRTPSLQRHQRRVLREWSCEDELVLLRNACLLDFWAFFLYAAGCGVNPKGKNWVDYQVHEPMARWFQEHIDEWMGWRAERALDPDLPARPKHLAILVHRGVGKTWMFTHAGLLWLQLRDPEMSIYIGSEKTELAQQSLKSIQAIIDGSDPYAFFARLYGNWSTASRKWTGKEIVHVARKNVARRDPSVGTFAVETSIVGAHPDAIFYDDPISYDRLSTDTNWLNTVWGQTTSLIPVIQADGLMVWIGTRYDDRDHFGRAFELPKDGGHGVASLTGMPTDSIEVTENGLWHVYFMAGRDKEGHPTTPKSWPEKKLLYFDSTEHDRYAAQIMNDPTLSDANKITREQIKSRIIPVSRVPWNGLRYAILCDTAFWDGRRLLDKDETVYQVWGYTRDGSGEVYYVEGGGSNSWRSEDFADILVKLVQRYRSQYRQIIAITDEVTMAGKKGAWRMSLQNYFHDAGMRMPRFIEFDRRGARKMDRIAKSTSFWLDGTVWLVEGAPGLKQLTDQVATIGQLMLKPNRKNDWVDAAADVFEPELYNPMRKRETGKDDHGKLAPWDRNSRLLEVEGLDLDQWEDDDRAWAAGAPRPPIR